MPKGREGRETGMEREVGEDEGRGRLGRMKGKMKDVGKTGDE